MILTFNQENMYSPYSIETPTNQYSSLAADIANLLLGLCVDMDTAELLDTEQQRVNAVPI